MRSQESVGEQEKSLEQAPLAQLEETIRHAEKLTNHREQQNEHVAIDIESLPKSVDTEHFKERLTKLKNIQTEMKQAVLAASLLALIHGQALAVSAPKDISALSQNQEDSSSSSAPIVNQTNMTLEIIKGVAEAVLEQKKKDGREVVTGEDSEGKKIETTDRVGKASGMIPQQIPKLGNIASLISVVIDIQKEAKEAVPGYEKNIAGRVAKLIADIPTFGLASYAWDMLSKREEARKNGTLVFEKPTTQQSEATEANLLTKESLPVEGDGSGLDFENSIKQPEH